MRPEAEASDAKSMVVSASESKLGSSYTYLVFDLVEFYTMGCVANSKEFFLKFLIV